MTQPFPAPYVSARGLGRAARMLVAAAALAILTAGVLEVVGRGAMERVEAEQGHPADLVVTLAYALAAVAQLALLAAGGAVVVMWIYRTVRNLPALGLPAEDTPAWAAWAWFIPFVNLIAPYRVVRRLHRALGPGGPITGPWWLAWIVGNLLQGASARKPVEGTGLGLLFAVAGAALLAVAGVLFTRIVGAIQDGAEARAAALQRAPGG